MYEEFTLADGRRSGKQRDRAPLVARRRALPVVRQGVARRRPRWLWRPARRDRRARSPVVAGRPPHLAVPDDPLPRRRLGLRRFRPPRPPSRTPPAPPPPPAPP